MAALILVVEKRSFSGDVEVQIAWSKQPVGKNRMKELGHMQSGNLLQNWQVMEGFPEKEP